MSSGSRMNCPGNGVYVVQGEITTLLTAMKKVNRWSSYNNQEEESDILVRGLNDLKDDLNQIGDLRELEPNHFVNPFLDVIRSEDTIGPVTSLALSSVNKFLSYGLIDPNCKSIATTVKSISDAVTRAKFVGTDQSSDSVVLMTILQVLRTLVLSPEGIWLTHDCVCEILSSCFRMYFDTRVNELLRRCAENYLKDMIQLLFTRLPLFADELRKNNVNQKLKMPSSSAIESSRGKRKPKLKQKKKSEDRSEDKSINSDVNSNAFLENEHRTPLLQNQKSEEFSNALPTPTETEPIIPKPEESLLVPQIPCTHNVVISIEDSSSNSGEPHEEPPEEVPILVCTEPVQKDIEMGEIPSQNVQNPPTPTTPGPESQDYFNQQGVRFTAEEEEDSAFGSAPYGLTSIHELLSFLALLFDSNEKQNSDASIPMGLSLLTVALEVGADSISNYPSLMATIKDNICRNLFSLLSSERLSVFASVLQVSFLLFESMRTSLKFQLENYLTRLTEIIVSDASKASYEHREIALESLVQLWRIPGLVTELYLNYDCALYCPNLYEELTNVLSKNAFPKTGIYNTHLLSLDALLTVIDSIESHCNSRILNERESQGEQRPQVNYIFRTGTRQKITSNIPSHEHLIAIKRKKKLLSIGTDQFNSKPKKGIQFLMEQNLLSSPLEPSEVVAFLRENPQLDKKMIGEYISNRANLNVLDCFVKSFDFTNLRVDEALRLYLESFRLPGESPLISLVMEQFAEHWHKCNNEPFVNADAAFTLAYAIIMLNVDQHNHNVKRQNNPMTSDDFKRNLKKVNGGSDFDEDMLDEIYNSIKNEEIVMPAEQSGIVKENYLWKVLLRRGQNKEGDYMHAPNGLLDHDLFALIWGPTVTALSSLFDKANSPAIYQKALSGFRKCAMISAHYGMSVDFDNLIVTLSKFTMLHYQESPENVTIMFGSNPKAILAVKTVFHLAHRHGDIIREGWKNILECILQLYKCKLLPKILIEVEDFIDISGKVSLIREEIQLNPKTETGILSSLYSYVLLGEQSVHKGPSSEDQEAIRHAQNAIRECHLEQLITESKFLQQDSLQYFVRALVTASYGPEGHISLGSAYSEDTAVFFLELLLKVVIQNRDRIGPLWSTVREHIYTLLMGAAACDHHFLVERCVVGLLRLAIRLMHREEMSPAVLQSLRMLLLLKGSTLNRVSRQVSFGMHELLKTSAANIHSAADWAIIFTLLECVGAGAPPPKVVSKSFNESGARSDGESDSGIVNERGYTSDSELNKSSGAPLLSPNGSEIALNTSTGWIIVGKEGEIQPVSLGGRVPPNNFSILEKELMNHDPCSMVKCCESLVFLVRDVVHITPYNFQNCVHCLRTFVEAAADANEKKISSKIKESSTKNRKKAGIKKKEERAKSPTNNAYDADESDPEDTPGYQLVCIQLLDLMHTIHTRTAQIFKWWAEETNEAEHISLWPNAWCPLLQGIARLSSHPNRQIRMNAITYLQRALLVQDLQTLSGEEWESCFTQVLFPLLDRLLEPMATKEGLEETRIRAATVLSKVFLHHLTPLQQLTSFVQLWLTILDYMEKYMHADNSDLLYEAIPESLKNILLVMDSANVFAGQDGKNEIWVVTWDKINSFLPKLQAELFKPKTELKIEKPVENLNEIKVEPSSPKPQVSKSRPGEILEISGPTSTPQNWQPSLPILPHMGQLISTPIGPSTNSPPTNSLPVYSGFTGIQQQSSVPTAQFFYQDMVQTPHITPLIQPNGAAHPSLLLGPTGLMESTPIQIIPPPTSLQS